VAPRNRAVVEVDDVSISPSSKTVRSATSHFQPSVISLSSRRSRRDSWPPPDLTRYWQTSDMFDRTAIPRRQPGVLRRAQVNTARFSVRSTRRPATRRHRSHRTPSTPDTDSWARPATPRTGRRHCRHSFEATGHMRWPDVFRPAGHVCCTGASREFEKEPRSPDPSANRRGSLLSGIWIWN